MSKRKLVVMWITILVLVAMCMMPSYKAGRTIWAWELGTRGIVKLAVQCGLAAIAGGGVIFTMRRGRKNKQKSGDDGGEE